VNAREHDDALMCVILQEAAADLEAFCLVNKLRYANERDHLSKSVKRAVERAADEIAPRPALHPFAFGDRHGWVGLGHVDVVFRWPERPPTFLELKCGAGNHSLRACVWDVVKLATAVLGGNASTAYLLAGAPAVVWRAKCPGSEFFESGEWETLERDIRGRFRSDWSFWESESTPHIPGRVPAAFATLKLEHAALKIAGVPWELRVARVEPTGRGWTDWPSSQHGAASL
jgi:hypothetical protein